MAENLNYDAGSGSSFYNNSRDLGDTYGRLYTWTVAMNGEYSRSQGNVRGVCPVGWHLPSDNEWHKLALAIDPYAKLSDTETSLGGKLKEKGTIHWNSPNGEATNQTGFTALPGGIKSDSGVYGGLGEGGCWWSSTEYNSNIAWYRNLGKVNGTFARLAGTNINKQFAFSVRCVKD
jgi:uncharacterized protein (TIGR02145 family)